MLNKKREIGIIAVIIAALTVMAIVCGIAIKSTQKDSSGFTISDGGTVLTVDCEGVSMTAMAIAVEDYEAKGISAMAEQAYSLHATVKPDSLRNKEVNWKINFQNSESAWAQNKVLTDYIRLTLQDDNQSVNLECLKPFGEKIVVTATSKQDSSKFATCVLDYKEKILGFDVKLNDIIYKPNTQNFEYANGKKLSECRVSPNCVEDFSAEYEVTFYRSEAYTIAAEPVTFYFKMTPTEELKNLLNDAGVDGSAAKTYAIKESNGLSGTISEFFDKNWSEAIYGGNKNLDSRDKLIYAILDNESVKVYKLEIYDKEGGKLLHSYDIVFDVSIIADQIAVEGVEMDHSNLVF